MKTVRLFALLAAAQPLGGCKLANAPFDAVGRLFQITGRAFHLSSEGGKSPDALDLDPGQVHEALAQALPDPGGTQRAATAALAGR